MIFLSIYFDLIYGNSIAEEGFFNKDQNKPFTVDGFSGLINPSTPIKLNGKDYIIKVNGIKSITGKDMGTIKISLIDPEGKARISSCTVEFSNKELDALYTNPKYRGHHLTEGMLRYVMKTFKPTNLQVSDDNEKAIPLYKKLGFKFARDLGDGIHEYTISGKPTE